MLQNREGKRVPDVSFRTRANDQWVDVRSADIFDGKTVVLFALPGAFTPTCSTNHLPRFNELAPAIREQGVDEIVSLSVNDAFVMNAWARDQGAANVEVEGDPFEVSDADTMLRYLESA